MPQQRRTALLACAALIGALSLVGAADAAGTSQTASPSAATAEATRAGITWTLHKSPEPSADELDAYDRIEAAMSAAVARWTAHSPAVKTLNVHYAPGVPTAEASYNGDVRFGADRAYMNEFTALHEISHTLGIGQTGAFFARCDADDWPIATDLLRSWDGPDARVNCGGGHIWPYGLNYANEYGDEAATRHVLLIDAMLRDGL